MRKGMRKTDDREGRERERERMGRVILSFNIKAYHKKTVGYCLISTFCSFLKAYIYRLKRKRKAQ